MRAARSVVVALLFGVTSLTPAHATDSFEYWSYWQSDGSAWTYAQVGPAVSPVVDGAIDGWRFGVGTDGGATPPSLAPDFEAACGSVQATPGKVRLAIFIDSGSAGPAPSATCALVDEGLSRASALSEIAELRTNNGFICAINGFPASGCADAPVAAAPQEQDAPVDGGSPLATVVTVILAGVTLALALRNARIQRSQ